MLYQLIVSWYISALFLKFWLVLVLIESMISVRFQDELKLGVPFSKLMGSFNRYVIVLNFYMK